MIFSFEAILQYIRCYIIYNIYIQSIEKFHILLEIILQADSKCQNILYIQRTQDFAFDLILLLSKTIYFVVWKYCNPSKNIYFLFIEINIKNDWFSIVLYYTMQSFVYSHNNKSISWYCIKNFGHIVGIHFVCSN